MKNIITSILVLFVGYSVHAQSWTIEQDVKWLPASTTVSLGKQMMSIPAFEDAVYYNEHKGLGSIIVTIPAAQDGDVRAQWGDQTWEAIPDDLSKEIHQLLTEEVALETQLTKSRSSYFIQTHFLPFRIKNNQVEKLTSFTLLVDLLPKSTPIQNRNGHPTTSILADGQVYQIDVSEEGLYKMDYAFLKNNLGMVDLDNIDPRKLALFGFQGGALTESLSDDFRSDPSANAILIVGENDGSFDAQDYILFYASGPTPVILAENETRVTIKPHYYDTKTSFYLKIDPAHAKRIATQPKAANAQVSTATIHTVKRHENNTDNVLHNRYGTEGSGRVWFGDVLKNGNNKSFDFNFPNAVSGENGRVYAQALVRSASFSKINLTCNDLTTSARGNGVILSSSNADYGDIVTIDEPFTSTGNLVNVLINHQANNYLTDEGWIDYLEVTQPSNIHVNDVPAIGYWLGANAYDQVSYEAIITGNDGSIWDVSDPYNVTVLESDKINKSNQLTITTTIQNNKTTPKIAVYGSNSNFLTPAAATLGPITHQNLHGYSQIDMLIIYFKEAAQAAEKLAAHRRSHDNLNTAIVEIEDIYREFGSGAKDISAIRNFCKVLYDRSPDFKFLLLMGDASFDYKNNLGLNQPEDFIPTYETPNSIDGVLAYPSDDYYGLLDDDEGLQLNGSLDIGIGRLAVRDATEAMDVVDKIIYYDTSPDRFGDWRLRMNFIGDDGDDNLHFKQCNNVSDLTSTAHPDYNCEKVFLDAFEIISTPSGARVPDAQEKINQAMFKGNLILNYVGHGGPRGLSQERVITNNEINSWNNLSALPFWVTATCSFTPFDEYEINSSGELLQRMPHGGAIGLFTTVRPVYASQNDKLNRAVFQNILNVDATGKAQTLGELFSYAKNQAGETNENSRKFLLLGDPAQRLAIPQLKIVADSINRSAVNDTTTSLPVGPLDFVEITGHVESLAGNHQSDFNGEISVTVYDEMGKFYTLGQFDGNTPAPYDQRKGIIFRGKATVSAGTFTVSFVMPRNLTSDGLGRISFYAHDNNIDAAGHFNQLQLSKTKQNNIIDNEPPEVEVFMDSFIFRKGGITSPNPVLLARVRDDVGLNTSTTGIGQELTAIFNEDTKSIIVLNDFFEADLDNHLAGTIAYPLSNLPAGRYSVVVKAWDVANNSGVGQTEFVVIDNDSPVLEQLLNFPNPFRDETTISFEHNMSGQSIQVEAHIFNQLGQHVRTLSKAYIPTDSRDISLTWNGRTDFDVPVAAGVYILQLSITTKDADNPQTVTASQKIVVTP